MKNILLLLLLNVFSYSLLAQTTDLQKGLVAQYLFDGNEGNAKNKGATSISKDRFGNRNAAGYFTGRVYIDLGNLNLNNDFTYVGWYLTAVNSATNPILSTRHTENTTSLTVFLENGVLKAIIDGSGYQEGKGTTTVTNDSQWHMFAVTKERNTYKLYTDDTYFGSFYSSKPLSSANLHIGHHGAWDASSNRDKYHGFFGGSLDDIRIYDRTLSNEEIKALFQLVENKDAVVSSNNSVSVVDNITTTNSVTATVEQKIDTKTTEITLDPYYERIIEQADILVTGRVFDKKQEDLPGATVKYDLQNGTSTDLYGKFELKLIPNTYTMTFRWGEFFFKKDVKIEVGKSYSLLVQLTKDKKKSFSYCNLKESIDEEIELFRKIYSNYNLDDINLYFVDYNEGRFRIEVKKIKNEVEAYQKAMEKKDYEELEQFSRTYPKSRYNKDIEKHFAKIEAEVNSGIFTGTTKTATREGNYEGSFKNGKKNGKGTIHYKNGDTYKGDWVNDIREGTGTYIWINGDKYIGTWKNDNYDAYGSIFYKDGKKYTGQWKNGLKDGKGTYTYANGDKHIGEWKNDEKDGQGELIIKSSKDSYKATWKNGTLVGEATISYGSGDKYVGGYTSGDRNGQGTYIFKSGAKYIGQFKDGNYHGYGTLYSPTGKVRYEGNWEDDEKKGKGKLYDENGKLVYSGNFPYTPPVETVASSSSASNSHSSNSSSRKVDLSKWDMGDMIRWKDVQKKNYTEGALMFQKNMYRSITYYMTAYVEKWNADRTKFLVRINTVEATGYEECSDCNMTGAQRKKLSYSYLNYFGRELYGDELIWIDPYQDTRWEK